jgi:hypothetical protein
MLITAREIFDEAWNDSRGATEQQLIDLVSNFCKFVSRATVLENRITTEGKLLQEVTGGVLGS